MSGSRQIRRGYNGDMQSAFATYLMGVSAGHAWMVGCAALYLAWWAVFFRPRESKLHGVEYVVGVACILGAVACGLVGVVGLAQNAGALPHTVNGGIVALVAVATYVVFAAVTARVFNRPVTTELALIVAWAALEWFVLDGVAGTGASAVLPVLLVAAACVFSMICYVLYYRLHGWKAFWDGCGPLIAAGVVSLAFAALL